MQQSKGCRRLWVAVLEQAILDLSIPAHERAKSDEKRADYESANFFLQQSNPRFHFVCGLLDMDPTRILLALKKNPAMRAAA